MTKKQKFVLLDDVLNRLPSIDKDEFLLSFGENDAGDLVFDDLDHMKDIFITGEKGSGKSVLLRSLILQMMVRYSPEDVKFILVDTKNCDLVQFSETPHLYYPLITDSKIAGLVFNKLNDVIRERFELCMELEASNIMEYNSKINGDFNKMKLPKIIVIIDEISDIKEASKTLLWSLSFGASMGIHFIIAGDLEKMKNINDVILTKSKLKILMKLDDRDLAKKFLKEESQELLGNGDCLLKLKKEKQVHLQAPYSDGEFINEKLDFIKKSYPTSFYDENFVKSVNEDMEAYINPVSIKNTNK